jgi:hypothetical protein
MTRTAKKIRQLNFNLTRRVIELHAQGYHFDYLALGNCQLLCIQNNRAIPAATANINVVGQAYDQLSRSLKYIHTIDSGNGEMGVMIAETIYTTQKQL